LEDTDNKVVDASFLNRQPYTTLATLNSYEANPYWDQFQSKLITLAEKHQLQDVSNPVIGFTLHGSAAKGYWKPGSDIDGQLIIRGGSTEEIEAYREVYLTLESLFPGKTHTDRVQFDENPARVVAGMSNYLLTGIFVGDYQRMQQLQKEYIERMKAKPNGEELWTRDQHFIAEKCLGIDKLFHEGWNDYPRWDAEWIKKYGELNLNDDQKMLLRAVTAIRKVPPTLGEISIH